MKKETNKSKMKFIKTSDRDTAQYLRECGYTELTESSSATYCFINDGKMVFGEDEVKSKLVYSNVLCI